MRIGVLAFRGDTAAVTMWTPTAEYLSTEVHGFQFDIVPLDLEEMAEAVGGRRVDFVLTNPGNYVDLEARFGISRIATLKNLRQAKAYTQFGAVIFTRADHPSVGTLGDLRGRSLMAVSPNAFGGFQMAWKELLDHDIDPYRDLSALRFGGFPQDEIVYAVRDGVVDAGTVRTDTMERMAQEGKIELGQFRVLGARTTEGFPFLHSTQLYPEWPFAKLKHTPDALAERVAVALLELPAESAVARAARSAGWTIPLDYNAVHDLFKTLKVGPYLHLGEVSWRTIWEEYGHWLIVSVLTLLAMIALTAYVMSINRRIAASEQALRREVKERELVQQELAAHRDTLEQRVAERTRELRELNSALRRSEATLRQLHDITASATIGFPDKVMALLEIGCRHLGLDNAALTHAEGSRCRILYAYPQRGRIQAGDTMELENTLCAFALRARAPFTVTDVAESDYWGHPFFTDLGRRCYFGTPVFVDGEPYGTLNFSSDRPRPEPFNRVDVDVLMLMAQWIGGEIERGRTQERLEGHQAQLAQVSRLNTMGEMATGIAHELNQPLTAIINYSRGCLRRLRAQTAVESGVFAAIEKIAGEAERAAQVVKRIREFVRKGELQRETVDLHSVVSGVVTMLEPQLSRSRIDLVVDVPSELPPVYADRIQLEQVLINLIRNAVDALREHQSAAPRIRIAAEAEGGGFAVLRVEDNGPGIDAAELNEVFHPFYTTKKDGMGMGLSISRSVMEAHGGTLAAKSEPGRGATFVCTLPLADTRTRGGKAVSGMAAP